jgi:hypothetical protein
MILYIFCQSNTNPDKELVIKLTYNNYKSEFLFAKLTANLCKGKDQTHKPNIILIIITNKNK